MKKKPEEVRNRGVYLIIIRAIYDKPMVNIVLTGGNRIFHLKFRMRQVYSLSLLLGLMLSFRNKTRQKGGQMGKREVKLFLFADNIILNLKKPERFHQKTPVHKHFEQSSRIQN